MNVLREDVDQLNARLKVQISKTDYEPKFNEALKKYRKQINMPGFRKGFVPEGLVKKMYGDSILSEELTRLASEQVDAFINEQKIEILGQPMPNEQSKVLVDARNLQDYEFIFDLGISPEVSMDYLKGRPSFEMKTIEVNDKLIESELDRMRNRFGKFSSPEQIQEKDLLYVDIVELGEDGLAKTDGIFNSTTITADMVKDEAAKAKLLAVKKGEAVQLNVKNIFDKEMQQVAKHILGIEEEQLHTASDLFEIRVNNISRMEPADLDEEFFKKVYPDKNIQTENELRDVIREELKSYVGQMARRKLYNKVAEALIDNVKMDLPDEFLRRWIKNTNEKPITDEQIAEEYPAFARSTKWNLIVNKIAKENDIKVDASEIENYTRGVMYESLSRYGINNLSEEQEKKFMANMMTDRQHVMRAHETVQANKVLDQVFTSLNIVEVPVSEEEFNKEA